MISQLVALLIAVVVVGIVAAIIMYLIDMLPVDARFKQIGKVLILLIAVLVILARALPLLGVATV